MVRWKKLTSKGAGRIFHKSLPHKVLRQKNFSQDSLLTKPIIEYRIRELMTVAYSAVLFRAAGNYKNRSSQRNPQRRAIWQRVNGNTNFRESMRRD